MGVTIHFEGKLRDEKAYEAVVSLATAFAQNRGWPSRMISERNVKLSRVRDEKDWTYEGPTKGVELQPHENSEPFRLEFDRDLYVQEYTKTQFAPLEVHQEIVTLLDEIASFFMTLEVIDEGEYYETRDEDALLRYRDECFEALDEHLANDPTLRGPVRLASGRIMDLIGDA
jgi:hypothetical protein